MRADRLQLFGLFGRGRHDQLAAIAVRDAMVGAIGVERALAADAHARHPAPGGVVDAGVDHFTVARGGDGADALGSLQHDDLAAGLREPPRHRKSDDAGPDNDALNPVHAPPGVPSMSLRGKSFFGKSEDRWRHAGKAGPSLTKR